MPLNTQTQFLLTADRLKSVIRNNKLVSGERYENSAEHTWHALLQTMVLADHAPKETDLGHVLKLLVVHDLIEIEAGDHWVTEENAAEVHALEQAAAEKVFSLLAEEQRREYKALWHEFEDAATQEAKFANAMDALHPMLMVFGPGSSGESHTDLSAAWLRKKKEPKLSPFPTLWDYGQSLLEEAEKKGFLSP